MEKTIEYGTITENYDSGAVRTWKNCYRETHEDGTILLIDWNGCELQDMPGVSYKFDSQQIILENDLKEFVANL